MNRRDLMTRTLTFGGLAAMNATSMVFADQNRSAVSRVQPANVSHPRPNPIGVSTYSFWRFQDDWKLSIPECISRSADIGFDFVEILEMQMDHYTVSGKTVAGEPPVRPNRAALAAIKRQALLLGMPLCGLSTHQGFLSPDVSVRRLNIQKTIDSIELAYALGIATMRVNTGRWGTSKNFDDLMQHRGIEPPLKGYADA